MRENELLALLEAVRSGEVTLEQAADCLKGELFEDLGYAKVDHHRAKRQGAAEVIFGEGKTPEQVDGIVRLSPGESRHKLLATKGPQQATRVHQNPKPGAD